MPQVSKNSSVAPQPGLGRNLRAIRIETRRSLTDVAAATFLSPSFLSMVENGSSDISIGRLLRLTQYYGVQVEDVLSSPDVPPQTPAHTERRVLNSSDEGLEIEFLAEAHHPMRPVLASFAPGSGMHDPLRDTGDAFLYVLAGQVSIEVEGRDTYTLGKGDSVYLLGSQARLYRNRTATPALMLSVVLRQ